MELESSLTEALDELEARIKSQILAELLLPNRLPLNVIEWS